MIKFDISPTCPWQALRASPWAPAATRIEAWPRGFHRAPGRNSDGKRLGKSWENRGKMMGKAWKIMGKAWNKMMGKAWKNDGKTVENYGI